jgi:lipoate synthase
MFVEALPRDDLHDLIAQARAVEIGGRVRARNPDVGVAAVSTPFTCRTLAKNVHIVVVHLLQYLRHNSHLLEVSSRTTMGRKA